NLHHKPVNPIQVHIPLTFENHSILRHLAIAVADKTAAIKRHLINWIAKTALSRYLPRKFSHFTGFCRFI
ncbi:hypothetical protein, partial [Chelonobacter oris]|uniref:hypothetical protein n=1 Tax=Chelonobacter oris TaxID=505317 RepID=UPI00244B6384